MGGRKQLHFYQGTITENDITMPTNIPSLDIGLLKKELINESQKMEKNAKLYTRKLGRLLNGENNPGLLEKIKNKKEKFDKHLKNLSQLNKIANMYIDNSVAMIDCFNQTEKAPSQDNPLWHFDRSQGIGASEAENPKMQRSSTTYRNWVKQKAGIVPKPDLSNNVYCLYGHQMEPIAGKILDHFLSTTLFESSSLKHKKFPFIRASLDRYGWVNNVPMIIEIKSPYSRIPMDGIIPDGYHQQMDQQHEVSQIYHVLFADFKFDTFKTKKGLLNSFQEDEDLKKKYYGVMIRVPKYETTDKECYIYSPMKCDIDKWEKKMRKIITKNNGNILKSTEIYWDHDNEGNKVNNYKFIYWKLCKLVLVPHIPNKNWNTNYLSYYADAWTSIMKYKNGFIDKEMEELEDAKKLFSNKENKMLEANDLSDSSDEESL